MAGIFVCVIQRARGVDLSASIHEIELLAPDRQAAEGLAAGMSGKLLVSGSGAH